MLQKAYQDMAQFLATAQDLLIIGHRDPDMDCVGSMLGLYHLFDGKAKNWQLALKDEVGNYMSYLPGFDIIKSPDQVQNIAAIVYVDCSDKARAGGAWLDAYDHLPAYCIDHHVSNNFTGQICLLEASASSAGEVVYKLGQVANLSLNQSAAICLYSAIVSDTGCFRYSNTSSETLAIAAKLLEFDIDTEQIRIALFESRDPKNMAMLGLALTHMTILAEGRLVYTYISAADMAAHQASKADLHDITNFTLMHEGCQIGIFFQECEQKIDISMRCRSAYRVDILASDLGGGGHKLAAGAHLDGDLDTIITMVINKALQLLK